MTNLKINLQYVYILYTLCTFTFLNIKKKFRKVVGIKKNNRLLGNKAYGKFLSSIW